MNRNALSLRRERSGTKLILPLRSYSLSAGVLKGFLFHKGQVLFLNTELPPNSSLKVVTDQETEKILWVFSAF